MVLPTGEGDLPLIHRCLIAKMCFATLLLLKLGLGSKVSFDRLLTFSHGSVIAVMMEAYWMP